MNNIEFYTRFKVLSSLNSTPERSKKLFEVIKVFERHNFGGKQITRLGEEQFKKKNITSVNIFCYLNEIEEKKRLGIAVPAILSTSNKEFNLIFSEEKFGNQSFDTIWFSFNSLIDKFPIIKDLSPLLHLLKDVFTAFNGFYAYSEDETLFQAYFTERSYLLALANAPEDLKRFVVKPKFDIIKSYNLPSLYLWNEIDVMKVPIGIWWINIFSTQHIKNLELRGNNSFEWAKVEKINNDAFLYTLTNDFLNLNNVMHLEKLRKTIEELNFIDRQRQNLLGEV